MILAAYTTRVLVAIAYGVIMDHFGRVWVAVPSMIGDLGGSPANHTASLVPVLPA